MSGATEVTVAQMDRAVAAADEVGVARHQHKSAGFASFKQRGFELFECFNFESIQSFVHEQQPWLANDGSG